MYESLRVGTARKKVSSLHDACASVCLECFGPSFRDLHVCLVLGVCAGKVQIWQQISLVSPTSPSKWKRKIMRRGLGGLGLELWRAWLAGRIISFWEVLLLHSGLAPECAVRKSRRGCNRDRRSWNRESHSLNNFCSTCQHRCPGAGRVQIPS